MNQKKINLKSRLFSKYKVLTYTFIALVAGIIIIILLASPIAKYLIEKYDFKYTGRQITINRAYLNPFTGYIYMSDFKMKESDSDSTFIGASSISVNFALFKMFSGTYEISELSLDNFIGRINQNKDKSNFDDLIKLFSGGDTLDTTKTHFNLMHFTMNNGKLSYIEKSVPINYAIKNINIESTGLQWYSDTIAGHFSFESSLGTGKAQSTFNVNLKTKDYHFDSQISDFDLTIIGQYLKALTNYGQFSAKLEANLNFKGNFNAKDDITFKGRLAINQFQFGKTKTDHYASFKKLAIAINELSPKYHKYLFDSISLLEPYIKYERYDSLDNVETMFGRNGSNITTNEADNAKFNLVIEIAKYVKILAKNFFQSDYEINRLAIVNGYVKFNDYSISEKFAADLNPLNVEGDSISKQHDRVNLSFASGIRPYGSISANLSVSPKDTADFDLKYSLTKLPAALFNPYLISFTSFPLDRGTLEVKGTWNVRNGMIDSHNHLIVIDPRVTKRLKNNDNTWLPLPLIMAFVRERGNVIDYEIPITGNLHDPKFHLHDVIFDLLGNIFIKPVTTPYRMEVKTVEREIEKVMTFKWEMRSSVFSKIQTKFAEKLNDFLKKSPEAQIVIRPQQYTAKEKEYILFFEAKKKYLEASKIIPGSNISSSDSDKINKMSVKDSLFVNYLDKQTKDSLIFSIQDKCSKLISASEVEKKYKLLTASRKAYFLSFFTDEEQKKQIVFKEDHNTIPYNGFSFYKIEYKNEIPDYLKKAYEKLKELNDEAPRKEFEAKRKSQKKA